MYLWIGAKCLHSLAKIGGQGISSVAALLGEGGVCLGDTSFVGMIDGLFVLGSGVGFGACRALVLCPSDVLVEELVVGRGLCPFVLAGLEASDGFEFECAGNGNGWG